MVGCGRLRRCLIVNYNRSRSVRGSGGGVVGCCRLWSAVVGCGRLRRCPIANCNRSRSVGGSGGGVVGCCRLWSAVVGCGAVLLQIAIDLAPLEGLVVAWSAVVGCGRLRRCPIANRNRSRSVRGSGGGCCRLWSAAALSYCKLQ